MNLYEVTFYLRDIAFEINKICGVEFDRQDGGQVRAKLKVEARNLEEAREKAEKKFLDVIVALSFCINYGIKINAMTKITMLKPIVIEKKSRRGFVKDEVSNVNL